jgi:hypothetical protein
MWKKLSTHPFTRLCTNYFFLVLLLIEKAKKFVGQNNFAAAINAYDSALRVDPTNIE